MAIADTINSIKTHLGEAYASLEEKGATIPENKNIENLADSISSVPSGGEPKLFNGSYDVEGLKAIGYTDEEIEYYNKYGVAWDSLYDVVYVLNDSELLGDDSDRTRFIHKESTRSNFYGYNRLLTVPKISNKTSVSFSICNSLIAVPEIDATLITSMRGMFSNCQSLRHVQFENTNSVTDMYNMFYYCKSLEKAPIMDTGNVTTMQQMFRECFSLKTIPEYDMHSVTTTENMFNTCNSLTNVSSFNTSSCTTMNGMFRYCYALKSIGQIDTHLVTDMSYMFNECKSLNSIPELDCSSCLLTYSMFSGCSASDFGGFKNLGQAFPIDYAANKYELDLRSSQKYITEQSMINILNKLYDIAAKGCNTQKITFGSALKRLTSEEGQQALANAQAKGWTVS